MLREAIVQQRMNVPSCKRQPPQPFENSRMWQSTFCFFKRFELSLAVERLERAQRWNHWNFAFEISLNQHLAVVRPRAWRQANFIDHLPGLAR